MTLLALGLAAALPGCGLLDARQTLVHLEDGRTLFAEGRRDICLRIESADGEIVDEECDLAEDALGMSEHTLFDLPDGRLLVGVAPVDVREVVVTIDDREQVVETIESDLTTGFYLLELPAGVETVTVAGLDEAGEEVAAPVQVIPAGGG